MVRVLERTRKSKKGKVITIKRTVVVRAVAAAAPTCPLSHQEKWKILFFTVFYFFYKKVIKSYKKLYKKS